MQYKVWVEITYPSSNFNGATVEVLEWISNFVPRFTGPVITDSTVQKCSWPSLALIYTSPLNIIISYRAKQICKNR